MVTIGKKLTFQNRNTYGTVSDESTGRWFTAILSVFLLSGPLKLMLNAFGIVSPVDLTLFSAICLLPFILFGKKLRTREIIVLSLFLIFMFYYVIRSLTEHSGLYAQEKLLYSFLNLFALLSVIRGGGFHLRTAFWIFTMIGLVFFVLVLMSLRFGFLEAIIYLLPVDNPSEVLAEFRAGYLTCGLVLTVSALLMKVAYPATRLLPVSIGAGLLCFLIGARGPVVFFILVLILMTVFNHSKDNSKLKWPRFLVILAILIIVVSLSGLMESSGDVDQLIGPSIQRFTNLSNFTGQSIDVRVNQIQFVFSSADSHLDVLIGHGVGSFGILFANMDVRMYPHNFLVELFFETGIIGVILMIWLLLSCLRGTFSDSFMFWIFLLIFFNAMKTYAFEDLRLLFAFAALTLISRPKLNVEKQLSKSYI